MKKKGTRYFQTFNGQSAKIFTHYIAAQSITRILKVIHAVSLIALLLLFFSVSISSSSSFQTVSGKTTAKDAPADSPDIKKPIKAKDLKNRALTPSTKPFLQIKRVYVFPKDNKLRVVIHNTGGGSLSSRDYFTGKLEITLLETSTRWMWPMIKVNQKRDHFIAETTFNTEKELVETTRVMVKIKGISSGKPWIGSLPVNNKAKKKSATVITTAPTGPEAQISRSNQKPKYKIKDIPRPLDLDLSGNEEIFIHSPSSGSRVDRDNPPHISWTIPSEFSKGSDMPKATFKVELLNNERVAAQIDARSYSYDTSSNRCTLPWAIGPDIRDGANYKIKVTLRPTNQYEYESNFTASMPGNFAIYSGVARGHSNGFTVYSPRYGQRYKVGDPIKVIYSWTPNPANANLADHVPEMVKITLNRRSTSPETGGNTQTWVQFVPEPIEMSVAANFGELDFPRSVYVHTITIPNRTNTGSGPCRLIPGTYSIDVRDGNARYFHMSGGVSGRFTIANDETSPTRVSGVRDGLINDPFEIVSPGVPPKSWLLENEQTVEWEFDPDLGDINWSVSIDMRSNGSGSYSVLSSAIEVSPNGTALVRFTLPRSFRLGTGDMKYAEINVSGLIPGGDNISTTRTVKIAKTIEMIFPDDNFSPGHALAADSTQKIRWFVGRNGLGNVGVALQNGTRTVKVIKPSMTARKGHNELDWCVFCNIPLEERSELMGPGYRIRVYSIQNPSIYDASTDFAISE